MPTCLGARNKHELPPEISALFREMAIPSFESLHKRGILDEAVCKSRYGDLSNSQPKISDLTPLDDNMDGFTSLSCKLGRTKRRILTTRREFCACHPLQQNGSFERFNEGRVSLTQIYVPKSNSFNSSQDANRECMTEGLWTNRQNLPRRCKTAVKGEKEADQLLTTYNLRETPLINQKPRLARANGDYFRMFALQNSMYRNGKLKTISVPMILEPKRSSMETEEWFGIKSRLNAEKSHSWSQITCCEY